MMMMMMMMMMMIKPVFECHARTEIRSRRYLYSLKGKLHFPPLLELRSINSINPFTTMFLRPNKFRKLPKNEIPSAITQTVVQLRCTHRKALSGRSRYGSLLLIKFAFVSKRLKDRKINLLPLLLLLLLFFLLLSLPATHTYTHSKNNPQ